MGRILPHSYLTACFTASRMGAWMACILPTGISHHRGRTLDGYRASSHDILRCRYRRKRDQMIRRTAAARLPTEWGTFQIFSYKSSVDGIEHVALVKVRRCSAERGPERQMR